MDIRSSDFLRALRQQRVQSELQPGFYPVSSLWCGLNSAGRMSLLQGSSGFSSIPTNISACLPSAAFRDPTPASLPRKPSDLPPRDTCVWCWPQSAPSEAAAIGVGLEELLGQEPCGWPLSAHQQRAQGTRWPGAGFIWLPPLPPIFSL